MLSAAQDVLRAIFNATRPAIEAHDQDEQPGAKLARKLAASPASLSRRPIVELARAVAEERAVSTYLSVPRFNSIPKRDQFVHDLEERAREPAKFIAGIAIHQNGLPTEGIVKYDTQTGVLLLNGWHPFVAAFNDEFINKRLGQPLELFAMAEVLLEAHLHSVGVAPSEIEALLSARDQLLRHLAIESGRKSALSIANDLTNARNSPQGLEDSVCDAFRSLGFDVTPLGRRGQPDGIAAAHLSAEVAGQTKKYSISLEAKSTAHEHGKVPAKDVDVAAVIRHRNSFGCDHAVVVAPSFPTSAGEKSALGESIITANEDSAAKGEGRTISLITVDDLARLVRLRPMKRLGLTKLRELFTECVLPDDSAHWVNAILGLDVETPPYPKIVRTIESLQKTFSNEGVTYAALRVELSHMEPPVKYETDGEVADLCKAMAQMAPGAIYAGPIVVELDQSAANTVASIEAAIQEYPVEERPDSFMA